MSAQQHTHTHTHTHTHARTHARTHAQTHTHRERYRQTEYLLPFSPSFHIKMKHVCLLLLEP